MPLLTLGARQGVLVFSLRVQKNGKVFTYLQITLPQQLIGLRANDDPVALHHGVVQQCIADRAAN